MFDANMRHLPKGRKFFCKIHYIDDGDLYLKGVRGGDIIECEMRRFSPENPLVTFKISGCNLKIREEDTGDSWIVYEGNVDGTGFICDKSRAIAMEMKTDLGSSLDTPIS